MEGPRHWSQSLRRKRSNLETPSSLRVLKLPLTFLQTTNPFQADPIDMKQIQSKSIMEVEVPWLVHTNNHFQSSKAANGRCSYYISCLYRYHFPFPPSSLPYISPLTAFGSAPHPTWSSRSPLLQSLHLATSLTDPRIQPLLPWPLTLSSV